MLCLPAGRAGVKRERSRDEWLQQDLRPAMFCTYEGVYAAYVVVRYVIQIRSRPRNGSPVEAVGFCSKRIKVKGKSAQEANDLGARVQRGLYALDGSWTSDLQVCRPARQLREGSLGMISANMPCFVVSCDPQIFTERATSTLSQPKRVLVPYVWKTWKELGYTVSAQQAGACVGVGVRWLYRVCLPGPCSQHCAGRIARCWRRLSPGTAVMRISRCFVRCAAASNLSGRQASRSAVASVHSNAPAGMECLYVQGKWNCRSEVQVTEGADA